MTWRMTEMRGDIYAQPQTGISLDECEFYHTCEIPGIGLVTGQWDLRRGLTQYLGSYDFTSKRVLEIGKDCSRSRSHRLAS